MNSVDCSEDGSVCIVMLSVDRVKCSVDIWKVVISNIECSIDSVKCSVDI